MVRTSIFFCLMIVVVSISGEGVADQVPASWRDDFPRTDFSRRSVAFDEILSGGPPRDGIPAIDQPKFADVNNVYDIADTEPVIGIVRNGVAKAYPLRVMMWHEIVNDSIGGTPIVVTYCPLCNSAIAFERRVKGHVLSFGTTGKLRNSDLIMYDRQTESWWQQFLGEAIIGELIGVELTAIPARLESFENFKHRAPTGKILIPNGRHLRDYGRNPYVLYDGRDAPYPLFMGELPRDIDPMARVVVVNGRAWSLALLRQKGTLTEHGLKFTWRAGQNSALDSERIADGRDVGNVVVTRNGEDAVYDVTFAFVYRAFHPQGLIRTE